VRKNIVYNVTLEKPQINPCGSIPKVNKASILKNYMRKFKTTISIIFSINYMNIKFLITNYFEQTSSEIIKKTPKSIFYNTSNNYLKLALDMSLNIS